MYTTVDGIRVWGEPLQNAVDQMRTVLETADDAALMGDHHKGYSVPIGGVVAYRGAISPSGVGFDIACGNLAVRLDARGPDIRRDIRRIMDEVWGTISFGVGRKNSEAVEHEVLDDPAWQELDAARPLRDLAREQLGTVGAGNHYVDIFVDEEDRAWVGVHFGSRGLGHKLATHFITAGGGRDGMDVPPVVLGAASDLGEQYIRAMRLAGRYAYAGRDWVCSRVAGIVGAPIVEEVHNHHNFAWQETHRGEELWVVRKGATPAFPGQRSFVGGTMGDISVILEGVDTPESAEALYSTVHGAGRVMSRNEAAGRRKWKKGRMERVSEGRVDWPRWLGEMAARGIELRGGGADEAPECYKRLPDVLEHHRPTVKIVHTLAPVGVAMASAETYDPYKD